MHNADQQMYLCIETWNKVLERDFDLKIIFAIEVIDIIAFYWEVSDEAKEDCFRRKGYLIQIIHTLNSMLDVIPEKIPSHWTEKDKHDIKYLFNNPDKILP